MKSDIRIFILIYILSFSIFMMGCDAFVRKFTRKPKKENLTKEEMVITPQEYEGLKLTKGELYRQYFLFWKSWHDELINALLGGLSNKKQVDCANEALKNLDQMRAVLQEAGQKKLDVYINQLKDLKRDIEHDLYGRNLSINRLTAERIRMRIMREFSYEKIKGYMG